MIMAITAGSAPANISSHLRQSLIRGKCSAKIHIQCTCSGVMFDKRLNDGNVRVELSFPVHVKDDEVLRCQAIHGFCEEIGIFEKEPSFC